MPNIDNAAHKTVDFRSFAPQQISTQPFSHRRQPVSLPSNLGLARASPAWGLVCAQSVPDVHRGGRVPDTRPLRRWVPVGRSASTGEEDEYAAFCRSRRAMRPCTCVCWRLHRPEGLGDAFACSAKFWGTTGSTRTRFQASLCSGYKPVGPWADEDASGDDDGNDELCFGASFCVLGRSWWSRVYVTDSSNQCPCGAHAAHSLPQDDAVGVAVPATHDISGADCVAPSGGGISDWVRGMSGDPSCNRSRPVATHCDPSRNPSRPVAARRDTSRDPSCDPNTNLNFSRLPHAPCPMEVGCFSACLGPHHTIKKVVFDCFYHHFRLRWSMRVPFEKRASDLRPFEMRASRLRYRRTRFQFG